MKQDRSQALLEKARKLIPGGVNSPVRAYGAVGGTPPFITGAQGATLTDEDGNTFLDFVLSWGPMILGHNHPEVLAALQAALPRGTSYGAPTEAEVRMAETVTRLMPHVEMVRMVNSGTEATMSAIRVARGATGRPGLVKVAGCYHGHGDSMLVAAGSGATTFGMPSSPGVPAGVAELTFVVPYNDAAALEQLLGEKAGAIACLILEPVAGNMGLVEPLPGYLADVRRITEKYGVLLIFDEVMTGFRVDLRGAQHRFGIKPDLTCLGKVIGGGLPVGAYGGRRDLMERVSPAGPIYQAGTLSGNPLAMAAGLATLAVLEREDPFAQLEARGKAMLEAWAGAAQEKGIGFSHSAVGSMFGFFFRAEKVRNYDEAKQSDTARFNRFFHAMLEAGIYLAPSAFEAGFLSVAHSDADLARAAEAGTRAIRAL